MRRALLLVCGLVPIGCAGLIGRQGEDLGKYATRAEVHAAFGMPVTQDKVDGLPAEDFRTHRKICDDGYRSPTYSMLTIMTLGLSELVLFPNELLKTGKGALLGREIRFVYDEDGKVVAAYLDGEPSLRITANQPAENPEPPLTIAEEPKPER